jgi:hypothetical protein
MMRNIVLGLAAVSSLAALPTAAEARHRHYGGYYGQAYYDRGYYDRGYYDQGYGNGYYGRPSYRHRCGSGTTGAIVGGAAGALLGREIGRSGRRGYYGYRRGGSGTTGAILGGVAGALLGREVGRSC